MPPELVIDKPLPTHPAFEADRVSRAFWRLSYRCGRRYLLGVDAIGEPILVQHEREKADSYARRLKVTKARNHCAPIVRRYNDFVFRQQAIRPEDVPGAYAEILKNADGRGTGLVPFMRRALKKAQIEREVYLLPDSTKPPGSVFTKAQATAAKVRPILRLIGADSVVWWRDTDGVMIEALVVLNDSAGVPFARWYGPETTIDIELKKDEEAREQIVAAVGVETAHPYGVCPLVRLRPMFDDSDEDADASPGESQIAPLAELQQDVANKLSLLDSELYDCTFSQWIASGVDKARVGELDTGNTRIICLPDPASTFSSIGADPEQAESIRKSIEDTQRELYRIAGVSTGDPTAGPGDAESGVAKAFKFNDLAANLSALADACEDAENAVIARLLTGQGVGDPPLADYPGDFDQPDLAAELETVIRVVTATALPGTIKRKVAQRFAERNLSLDAEEEATLEAELDSLGAEVADPFNPIGRKTGT